MYEFVLIENKDDRGRAHNNWYFHPRSLVEVVEWIAKYLKAAIDEATAEYNLIRTEYKGDTMFLAHFESPAGIMVHASNGIIIPVDDDNPLSWRIRQANILQDTIRGLLKAYEKHPDDLYLSQGPQYAVFRELNNPGHPLVIRTFEDDVLRYPGGSIPRFQHFRIEKDRQHYKACIDWPDDNNTPAWVSHQFEERDRYYLAVRDIYKFRRDTIKAITEVSETIQY